MVSKFSRGSGLISSFGRIRASLSGRALGPILSWALVPLRACYKKGIKGAKRPHLLFLFMTDRSSPSQEKKNFFHFFFSIYLHHYQEARLEILRVCSPLHSRSFKVKSPKSYVVFLYVRKLGFIKVGDNCSMKVLVLVCSCIEVE